MKNKKLITILLICILGLSSIGCTILNAETTEVMENDIIGNEKEDSIIEVQNATDEDCEMPSFTEYMGYEFGELTKEQIIALKGVYTEIEEFYEEEKSDELESKWIEFEDLLIFYTNSEK